MTGSAPTTSNEIRETFLRFFEQHGHKRLASASLVPAANDPSVLLTVAGMHPLKPYFLGTEQPPAQTVTTCQKCFRTEDLENVGVTARHLTFFEMLGNFSFGDYFKAGATKFAWDLTLNGFRFDPDKVWVTVFEGDEELGLGPDQETIDAWLEVGVSPDRIVLLGREDNFWSAGPVGPCGPCTELYLDRGPEYGAGEKPGDPDSDDRFLEFWNLVLMQYDRSAEGVLTPLPMQNIDTGMGLNRMAILLQGKETIFETDQFAPLIALGEQLSGKKYDAGDDDVDRALRILADHSRGTAFLTSDGVIPSNEGRGYVLRRIMRRAILQAKRIGIEGEVLPKYIDVVIETMSEAYPDLLSRKDELLTWVRAEERNFARTLEQGMGRLDSILEAGSLSGADAFELHDTFGFPVELTEEIAAERGIAWLGRDEFERLMEEQRKRSQGSSSKGDHGGAAAGSVVGRIDPRKTDFTGYGFTEQQTTVLGVLEENGKNYVKLALSPFYPEGGGQVSDHGVIVSDAADGGAATAKVVGMVRAGDDQAIIVEYEGDERLTAGQAVLAQVQRNERHATACNHTATHLLHAALREELGDHVRQAGSSVRPDKLRFDFSHPEKLTAEQVKRVEDRVNEQVLAANPVRAITTTLDEAKKMGAMALFGEKYGEVVRVVEIGDGSFSRELCGGVHVRSTAEIGAFKLTSEGSSAANVRRIEAVTGPVAIQTLRTNDSLLQSAAAVAKVPFDQLPARVQKLKDEAKSGKESSVELDEAALANTAEEIAGIKAVIAKLQNVEPKALPELADRIQGTLGSPGVVVLISDLQEKVAIVISVEQGLVGSGLNAGALIKQVAAPVGGGGGGKPTMAQAGGKDPSGIDAAMQVARETISSSLG